MKKPINIVYELGIFVAIILIIHYAYRTNVISRLTFGELHLYWLHIVSLLLLLSITSRTVIKKQYEKRFISSFYFGFFIGTYMWSTYAVSEFYSIRLDANAQNIFNLILGILSAGLIFAFIGSIISFFFEKIIKKVLEVNS